MSTIQLRLVTKGALSESSQCGLTCLLSFICAAFHKQSALRKEQLDEMQSEAHLSSSPGSKIINVEHLPRVLLPDGAVSSKQSDVQ